MLTFQEQDENQEDPREENSSEFLSHFYQMNQEEENEDSVTEIVYQQEQEQQDEQDQQQQQQEEQEQQDEPDQQQQQQEQEQQDEQDQQQQEQEQQDEQDQQQQQQQEQQDEQDQQQQQQEQQQQQQQQQLNNQEQQHANEHLTFVESVDGGSSKNRKRKNTGDSCPVVTSVYSRSETSSSSSATWVECDKCQRRIKFEEFASHYQEVHVELSTAQKCAQVWTS